MSPVSSQTRKTVSAFFFLPPFAMFAILENVPPGCTAAHCMERFIVSVCIILHTGSFAGPCAAVQTSTPWKCPVLTRGHHHRRDAE